MEIGLAFRALAERTDVAIGRRQSDPAHAAANHLVKTGHFRRPGPLPLLSRCCGRLSPLLATLAISISWLLVFHLYPSKTDGRPVAPFRHRCRKWKGSSARENESGTNLCSEGSCRIRSSGRPPGEKLGCCYLPPGYRLETTSKSISATTADCNAILSYRWSSVQIVSCMEMRNSGPTDRLTR